MYWCRTSTRVRHQDRPNPRSVCASCVVIHSQNIIGYILSIHSCMMYKIVQSFNQYQNNLKLLNFNIWISQSKLLRQIQLSPL